MYYKYLFELVIVGLLLITIPNYVIYKLVKEFDKVTYIEGYKNKKRPDVLLARLVYTVGSFIFMILSFVALVYYGASKKVERKKLIVTFSNILVTPVIGIILPIVWLIYCRNVAMSNDFYGLANLLWYLRIIHTYTSIPFYLVLAIRQQTKLTTIETKMLYEYVNKVEEYDSKSKKSKLWPKVKLESEFADNYLIYYKSIDEWKQDSFNIINYGFFYKTLVVFSSCIGLLINILISVIYFDVLDKPYPISPTGYHIMSSPFWGDQYFFFYIYFALVTLLVFIYLVLSYLFNSRSIILFRRKETTNINEAKTFKESWSLSEYFRLINYKRVTTIIKQAVIIILTIYVGCLMIKVYPINFNYLYERLSFKMHTPGYIEDLINVSFDDNKEKVVEAVENKTNYANFTEGEKYGYIMNHPEKFIDDLDVLGFVDQEDHTQNSYVYIPTNPDFYIEIPFEKEARPLYPDYKYDIYIGLYTSGFQVYLDYTPSQKEGVNFCSDAFFYKDFCKDNISSYSNEEKALYDEMEDTVYGLIDQLFAMEMRNQNMEEPKFLSSLS